MNIPPFPQIIDVERFKVFADCNAYVVGHWRQVHDALPPWNCSEYRDAVVTNVLRMGKGSRALAYVLEVYLTDAAIGAHWFDAPLHKVDDWELKPHEERQIQAAIKEAALIFKSRRL